MNRSDDTWCAPYEVNEDQVCLELLDGEMDKHPQLRRVLCPDGWCKDDVRLVLESGKTAIKGYFNGQLSRRQVTITRSGSTSFDGPFAVAHDEMSQTTSYEAVGQILAKPIKVIVGASKSEFRETKAR